ncbi:MAG: TonB-dependent receptor [Bacteroidales bacterium]|nr:TonB-dependent receptor [Bacteroidales bacterium]MCF8336939.1 TonB-dependent receptor [Bacteroidales bacterium]
MTLQRLLIVILVGMALQGFSQTGKIKGRVFDAKTNEPLPFSNLLIYDTQIGSTSDPEGNFTFTGIEPGYVKLKVSSVGYETKITEEIMVTTNKTTYIEIPMEKTSYDLEEVTIEASPFKRKEESPVSLRSLGISEIEQTPGANRDISRVIQSLPGVSSSVAFRNDVIVRGGGPNENSFFLDGVEIPNLNHFSTQGSSGGPVGIINADFLREVDFYSGAFPASRGGALSSVLDMKMKTGNTDDLNFKGTVGASDLALTTEGPLSDNTTMIFSVRRSYLQFLFNYIGLPFLPTYNDLQFKTKTKIDQKNELIFLGIGAIDQFELNTELENPTDDQRYQLNNLPINEQYTYTVGGVYKHYGDKGFDRLVISRNVLNNSAYKYKNNVEKPENKQLDLTSVETENKLRYEHNGRANGFQYSYGAGIENATYTNDLFQKRLINDSIITIDNDNEISINSWSAFGQISKGFLQDRLTLSIGMRADANDYSDEMNNLLDQFSPRFSLSYGLTEKLYLNFNTGRYYKRPPYTTLGYRNKQSRLVNKENEITYIQSDHYVGGLEYLPGKNAKITGELFYKKYDDYPFSVNDSVSISSKSAGFGVFGDEEVTSSSEGRAYGFELFTRLPSFKKYNIILSYTYVRSEFKDYDGNYVPTSWDNRNILNLTVRKNFKKNWEAGIKWRYVGGSPYTPYDVEKSRITANWDIRNGPFPDYSRFNEKRLDAFHQLDVRVDKLFNFDKWMLGLYLDIQNLYNFQAERQDILTNLDKNGNPNYVDPDNKEKYDLRRIEQKSGTLLPTIGIKVEF